MAAERVHHPVFARIYERLAPGMDAAGAAEHRRELLAGLSGRVAEVGAGAGANFRHYPAEVTDVVAIEPEPHLRGLAEKAARTAPVPVTVREGLAGSIPLEDEGVDAVVASLMLCSVPDQGAALTEMRRVLRPGGELRFYEHVRAGDPRLARTQALLDRSRLWPLVAGGCHCSRDTVAAIAASGLQIERCREFSFRPGRMAPPFTAPHVLGMARR
jgi:ubiquinone/menaquinone biosynthesis C-methylase UbiE